MKTYKFTYQLGYRELQKAILDFGRKKFKGMNKGRFKYVQSGDFHYLHGPSFGVQFQRKVKGKEK